MGKESVDKFSHDHVRALLSKGMVAEEISRAMEIPLDHIQQYQASEDQPGQEAFCKARLNKLDEKVKELRCIRTNRLMHEPMQLEDENLCDKVALKKNEPSMPYVGKNSKIVKFIKEALVVVAKCLKHGIEVERAVSLSAECLSALRADEHYRAYISVFSALKTRELEMRLLEQMRALRPIQLMELLVRVANIESQFVTTVQLIEAIPAAMLVTGRNEVIELIRVEESRSHSSEMRAELLREMLALKITEGDFDESRNDSVYEGKLSEIYCKLGRVFEFSRDLDRAEEYYKISKTLDHSPEAQSAYKSNQARLLCLRTRDLDQAHQLLQESLDLLASSHPLRQAEIYNQLGKVFRLKEELDKAEEYCMKALALREASLPEVHADIGRSCISLGRIYLAKRDSVKAEEFCMRSLNIRSQMLPPHHKDLANSYEVLGRLHKQLNDLARAEESFTCCLNIRQVVLPSQDLRLSQAYCNLASLYRKKGNLDAAQAQITNAKAAFPGDISFSKKLLSSKLSLIEGKVYQDQEDLGMAEEKFNESYYIRRRILPQDHSLLAQVHEALGKLWELRSDLDKSLEHDNKCLYIREKHQSHKGVVRVELHKSEVLYSLGMSSKKETYFRQSLQIKERLPQDNNPHLAKVYEGLGIMLLQQQDLSEAEEILNRNHTIRLEGEAAALARSYNNLGLLYTAKGEFDKAEVKLQEGLKMREALFSSPHPELISSLNSLGRLALAQGNLTRAEDYLLKHMQPMLTQDPVSLFDVCESFGRLYMLKEDWNNAETFLNKCIQIQGYPDDLSTAQIHELLGDLHLKNQRIREAQKQFESVLKIRNTILKSDHSQVIKAAVALGKSYSLNAEDANKAPKVFEKYKVPKDHPDYGYVYLNQGITLENKGDDEQAFKMISDCYDIWINHLTEIPSVDLRKFYDILSRLHLKKDNLELSEHFCRECVEISEQVKDSKVLAQDYFNLGCILLRTNREAAEEYLAKCWSIRQAEFPENSEELFDINLQLADLFSSMKSNQSALKHYQQCLKLKITTQDQRKILADIHFKQGVLFMDEGNLDEASSALNDSLKNDPTHNEKVYSKICEVFQIKKDQLCRQLGCELNHEFFMKVLQRRVEAHLRRLDIMEECLDITAYLVEIQSEEEFFEELIKINTQMKERVYTKLADVYIELVGCLIYMRDQETASSNYDLTLKKEDFQAWNIEHSSALRTKSYKLRSMKQMAWLSIIRNSTSLSSKRDTETESRFLEYLELLLNNQEEEFSTYFVLAEYFSFRNNLEKAKKYFNKCYQIRVSSENKADLRDICLACGRLYDQQQDNEKAEYFYRQCIEISEETRESKEVAEDCFNLGCLLLKSNRLEDAESYLAKSLSIRETKFAEDFTELFQTNLKLAELYSLQKDERVYQHYKKCRELKSLDAAKFKISCCKDQWDTNIEDCYKFYNDLILKFKGARLNVDDKQELTNTNFILGELFAFRFSKLIRQKEYGRVTQECKTSLVEAKNYFLECQRLREKYFSAELKDILIIKGKLANLYRQIDKNRAIQLYEQLIGECEREGIYFAEVLKAYYYLGKLHFYKGAYVKAVQVMEQCIELAENDYPNPTLLTKACYFMSTSYKQLGETKRTMCNAKMHTLLEERGVVVKSEDILEQSIKTNVIYCLKEQALEFKLDEDTDYEHELRSAGKYFEKYLLTAAQIKRKCYDELHAVYFQLGNLLVLKGSYREAKRLYLKCLNDRFTNTRDMSRADTLLSCCSYLMGDTHDIHDNFYSEFLRNAVEQSKPSERADAFFALGDCLYSRGVLDAAEDCYLKCLQIWSGGRQEITSDPNLFKLYTSLGVLYHAKGDLAKSDEYFALRGRKRQRLKKK
jgi:tetratricopeptide (TPR) repeat protein